MTDLSFWHFAQFVLCPIWRVSILVMTDLSFWLKNQNRVSTKCACFNPCYDGFVILTILESYIVISSSCFNPCYDGFVILTGRIIIGHVYMEGFNPCYDGFVILTQDWDDFFPIVIILKNSLRNSFAVSCSIRKF